jgi:uncharacterized protein
MPNTFKILSIDGGGIRGIIPATILAEIERRAERPISALFDLIAGTSTGGILALGLTVPDEESPAGPKYTARQAIELYEQQGRVIFHRSLWHQIIALGNLIEEKYPSAGIDGVLQEFFGEARLKEALTDVLIPSYEIQLRRPWFFRSRRARERPDYDFPVRSVARATSAAPTYFEAARIETDDPAVSYAFIDGGVFANNPAVAAFTEAQADYTGYDDYLVASLGTGEQGQPFPYAKARNWGALQWAEPILHILLDAASMTIDYELRLTLPNLNGTQRYYRFQTQLADHSEAIDDASPENIKRLKLLAERIIREQSGEIDDLCQRLKQ